MNNERVILAQELHDGIARDLAALGYCLDQVISMSDDPAVKSMLRELRFKTSDLIEKVRGEIHNLRSQAPIIDSDLQIDKRHEIERIVQELLLNIEKHSAADTISIQISDNGNGGAEIKDNSYGLRGLHERVSKLNGEIHIDSSANGTRIGVTIPWDR